MDKMDVLVVLLAFLFGVAVGQVLGKHNRQRIMHAIKRLEEIWPPKPPKPKRERES